MMDRKDFLKKGLLGTGMFIAGTSVEALVKNDVDELKALEVMGFNHLPTTKSTIMENAILHKADTRGDANHGWLHSKHSFSFANYYNPERMHFGVLRVLNDDVVAPGMGFGTHPHDNMEIISIPLDGDLEHRDSMGNTTVIRKGDIQVMSAGTGIQHSEYNKNKDRAVKFLQIWLFPNEKNVVPRYGQISLREEDRHNKLQQIVSPDPKDAGVWIHQNAWFNMGKFDKDQSIEYKLKAKGNGIYLFNLTGDLEVNGQTLSDRDAYGVWDIDAINIKTLTESEFLIMEVPMTVG